MQAIYASSPGIYVTQGDFNAAGVTGPVVLLPRTDTIGELITILDVSGLASAATPITVSTVAGLRFVEGTSTVRISSAQIRVAGDSVAVAAATPYTYMMIRSRDFPYSSVPFYLRPNYENISTVSTYTLDVVSSIVLPHGSALDPLRSIDGGPNSAVGVQSTTINTFTTSNFSTDRWNASRISTVHLSTQTLAASTLSAFDLVAVSSLSVQGDLGAGGASLNAAANFSTVFGGVPFQDANLYTQGAFTVDGVLNTAVNFKTTAGTFGICDGLIVSSNFNAGGLAVAGAALHQSSVIVRDTVSTANLYTFYDGTTSSFTIGNTFGSAQDAALDVSGAVFLSSILRDINTFPVGAISTNSYSASTVSLFNGEIMQDFYPSSGNYLLYGPTIMKTPAPVVTNLVLSSIFVSTFVSTAHMYPSTAFIGAKDYDSSYMFELNGGMNVGYKRPRIIVGGFFGTSATESIKISYDGGSNWANTTGGFSDTNGWCFDVAYGNNLWVAVGQQNGTNTIKYSLNGSNWSNSLRGGFQEQGVGVAFNGRRWVAVGFGPSGANLSTIQYSDNGISWSNIANTGSAGFGTDGLTTGANDVIWNGRMFIACGTSRTGGSNIQFSLNGINWSNANLPTGIANTRKLATNGRVNVFVGSNSSQYIWYSLNGSNWFAASVNPNFTATVRDVIWDGNVFLAYGGATLAQDSLKYSHDGINWRNTPNKTNWIDNSGGLHINYDGEKYYASAGGVIRYSFDLINWITAQGNNARTMYSSAFESDESPPSLKVNNFHFNTGNQQYDVLYSSINTLYTHTTGFFPDERTLSTNLTLNNLVHITPPRGIGIGGTVSSSEINLIVYGSTFTSDPNPIKPGGGNWTIFSDSNFKSTLEVSTEDYYSTTTGIFRQLKFRNFNYRRECGIESYVNHAAIARRNCFVHDNCASTCLTPLDTEEAQRTEIGFIAQNVATVLPDSVQQLNIGGRNYHALNVDQINMIHIATTHALMSTIYLQHSTLKAQEEMLEKINDNFLRIRAHLQG